MFENLRDLQIDIPQDRPMNEPAKVLSAPFLRVLGKIGLQYPLNSCECGFPTAELTPATSTGILSFHRISKESSAWPRYLQFVAPLILLSWARRSCMSTYLFLILRSARIIQR